MSKIRSLINPASAMKILSTMSKAAVEPRFLSTRNDKVLNGFTNNNLGSQEIWGDGGVLGGKIILNDFDLIIYEEPSTSTPEPFSKYELMDVTHFEFSKSFWFGHDEDITYLESSFAYPEPFAKFLREDITHFENPKSKFGNKKAVGAKILPNCYDKTFEEKINITNIEDPIANETSSSFRDTWLFSLRNDSKFSFLLNIF